MRWRRTLRWPTTSERRPEHVPELDIDAVRAQFPGLARTVDGRAAAFFDGPAGSQVPQRVADAVSHYLLHTNANWGGRFVTSRESDEIVEGAYHKLAALFGVGEHRSIITGPSMTALAFILADSLAKVWQPGDEVVVTRLDHQANVTPWEFAARKAGATIRLVPFRGAETELDLDVLRERLSDRTVFVAVTAAANATGTLVPVRQVADLVHDVGAELFVDAVHYAAHRLPNVSNWDCDYMACSAYKFFGPHVGALWGRSARMSVLPTESLPMAGDALPFRFNRGTPSYEGLAGTGAAIDYLASLGKGASLRTQLASGFASIRDYENKLAARLLEGLAGIDAVTVYGVTDPASVDHRVPTVAFTHERVDSTEIATRLGKAGVFVWSGHFGAKSIADDLDLSMHGLVRVGILHYNTEADIDRLLELVSEL